MNWHVYEQRKQRWLKDHPAASCAEYERAMTRIARECERSADTFRLLEIQTAKTPKQRRDAMRRADAAKAKRRAS